MMKKATQNNDVQVVNLLRQGIFEDEIADLVLEKVVSNPDFAPILEKYKAGEMDDFEFVDVVWQKFNDNLA